MSYLSRLIADSAPGPAGLRPASAPARLDVDVLREVAIRPAVAMRPAESPATPEALPHSPRAVPTNGRERDAPPSGLIPIHRDIEFRTAPPPSRREPDDPTRRRGTGPEPIGAPPLPAMSSASDRGHDVGTVVDAKPETRAPGSSPSSADPVPYQPVDAIQDAPASPRWDDVEIATRVIAPTPDERAVESPHEPARLPDAAAGPVGSLDLRREDVVPDHPELQQVSLSIGTIEVVVDAPSAPPPQLAPLPPVDGGRARPAPDDPIMRLRRQYVTWPEGR